MREIRYKVGKILEQYPSARDSDKILLHLYYKIYEGVKTNISMVETSPETITRCRRKLQEKHESLQAQEPIKIFRSAKQEQFRQSYSSH